MRLLAAAWEIFGCICNGGTLILGVNEREAAAKHVCVSASPHRISSQLNSHQIQVLIATPSMLVRLSPESFCKLDVVAAVGQDLQEHLADRWNSRTRVFWCCYGTPGLTIPSTMSRHVSRQPSILETGHSVANRGGQLALVRDPLPNTYLYILDDKKKQKPFGYVGSIWVGGIGVSNTFRGYDVNDYARNPFLNDK